MGPEWDFPVERDEPRLWLWSVAKFSRRKVHFRFRFSRAPPAQHLRDPSGLIIRRCLSLIVRNMSENADFSSDVDTSEEEIVSYSSGDETGEWTLVKKIERH